MKFRSKFDRGCLHYSIPKAYKRKDMQLFLENVQNDFELLKMIRNFKIF